MHLARQIAGVGWIVRKLMKPNGLPKERKGQRLGSICTSTSKVYAVDWCTVKIAAFIRECVILNGTRRI